MLTRSILSVAMLGLLAAQATAQQQATLDDLQAHRVDAGQVQVIFSYEGGACEEVGAAQAGEAEDDTLPLSFPTTSTAEVCTMQVVVIEVDQIVAAEESVTALDVTLLSTDGSVVGTGTAPISRH